MTSYSTNVFSLFFFKRMLIIIITIIIPFNVVNVCETKALELPVSPIVSALKGYFDSEVSKTAKSMAAGVREEFVLAMNQVFKNNITPMLKDIDNILEHANEIARDNINRVNDAVEQRIAQVEKLINDKLIQTANLVNQTIYTIRQQIIDPLIVQINNLREELIKDIDKIIASIGCELNKATQDLEAIRSKLIPNPFSFLFEPESLKQCRKELDINRELKMDEYTSIYLLKKCQIKKEMTPYMPIKTILAMYNDLKIMNKNVACISRRTQSDNFFLKDWLELQQSYQIWEQYYNFN